MNLPKRVLFGANDPGGANAILPVVQALLARGDSCTGVITGSAKEIFAQARILFIDATGIAEKALAKIIGTHVPDIFLAGRSTGLSIDKKILTLAKKRDIPSVYVLDFWKDYWRDFSYRGRDGMYLPDLICIMDELALREMRAEGFPERILRVTGNPHFEHFTKNIKSIHENQNQILFISQPIREIDGARYGFDEYSAFESILRGMQTLPETYRLVIRLHPKENSDKYEAYLNTRVFVSNANTLEDEISNSGLVIGMFSPVLIQAAMAGKRVVSYEPDLAAPDPLPTNRFGFTRRISNEKELNDVLAEYAAGRYISRTFNAGTMWPKGAASRIISVVDKLTR